MDKVPQKEDSVS